MVSEIRRRLRVRSPFVALVERDINKPRGKTAALNPGGETRAAFSFLAVFLRVTHEGPSEKGTTRSVCGTSTEFDC